MDEKLNVLLHEENVAVSSVVSEGQSPESTEQKEVIQKDTDICKVDATQDRSKPSTKTPEHIFVDSIIILDEGSTDEESIEVRLRMESLFTGEIKYATIKLKDWTQNKLRKCIAEKGYMSTDWKGLFKRLSTEIEDFRQTNSRIKTINGHTKVGWSKRAEDIVFYHKKMISSGNQSSEYMGGVDIDPKGSLDNIVNMIKQWILSTPEWSPLEAVIAFSVASVVLPYANCAFGKNINNLVVHLVGNSTTGKSTALRVHVGFASNPFNEKNGFWLNHQSSLVALIRRIGDNHGFPVGIDELSSGTKKEYTDFIYAIGNGDEKDRLKAGGTGMQDSAKFSLIILSSGEVSILKMSSKNAGIMARCIELRNVAWTDSKEQADSINACLMENYGLVAPLVAEELLNNSDLWKARWDQIYARVNSQMNKEKIQLSIGARISEYVVLVTLAAEIAKKVLNINLNVDKIYDFCYLHVILANADEANLAERAYEYLLRHASENPAEFPDVGYGTPVGSYCSKNKVKGFFREAQRNKIINGKEYDRQLVLFPDTYEKILKEGEFSPVVVSHELHEAGYLQSHDKKRHTLRLTYNDSNIKCYAIYCRQEDTMMADAMGDGSWNPNGEDDYEV